MNRLVLITGLITVVAFAILAYGTWGPLYATEPLRAPFSLADERVQTFSFRPGRTATYYVEVHLKEALPRSEMESILGDFLAGGGGAIDVGWTVANRGAAIAKGSSTEYGYSPIWGGGYSGLAIGRFEARRGKTYTLNLTSRGANPSWDRCEPVVEVGLHPSDLEYLIGYTMIGGVALLLVGPVFLGLLGVVLYRFATSRLSPDAETRHLTSA